MQDERQIEMDDYFSLSVRLKAIAGSKFLGILSRLSRSEKEIRKEVGWVAKTPAALTSF